MLAKNIIKNRNTLLNFKRGPINIFAPIFTNCSQDLKNDKQDDLLNLITKKITFQGPISIHEYMKIVLTHSTKGFYMKKNTLGAAGHFITSPELSQIFGEVLSVWLIQEWKRFNSIDKINIIEFGPGKGTLLKDICRIFSKFIETKNVNLHLIEVSPALKQEQQQLLCGNIGNQFTKEGYSIKWHTDYKQVPINDGFNIFLAHEFFDALPIYKFLKKEKEWCELLIDLDHDSPLRPKLKYVISKKPTLDIKKLFESNLNLDTDFEFCPSAIEISVNIAKILNKHPGLFLLCDYGFSKSIDKVINRDTFRSFKNHNHWDPLLEPGTADLTADVDFDTLVGTLNKQCTIYGPITQQQFLQCLGAHIRLLHLQKQAKTEQERKNIEAGLKMVMEDMGQKFKFLAMFPKNATKLFENDPPVGFYTNMNNNVSK